MYQAIRLAFRLSLAQADFGMVPVVVREVVGVLRCTLPSVLSCGSPAASLATPPLAVELGVRCPSLVSASVSPR